MKRLLTIPLGLSLLFAVTCSTPNLGGTQSGTFGLDNGTVGQLVPVTAPIRSIELHAAFAPVVDCPKIDPEDPDTQVLTDTGNTTYVNNDGASLKVQSGTATWNPGGGKGDSSSSTVVKVHGNAISDIGNLDDNDCLTLGDCANANITIAGSGQPAIWPSLTSWGTIYNPTSDNKVFLLPDGEGQLILTLVPAGKRKRFGMPCA